MLIFSECFLKSLDLSSLECPNFSENPPLAVPSSYLGNGLDRDILYWPFETGYVSG